MTNPIKKLLMDAKAYDAALDGMVEKIIATHDHLDNCAFIGIRTRGVFLAKRLKDKLKKKTGKDVPLGILDITLYRDDLTQIGPNPLVKSCDIMFSITGKNLILVDDVLYTGRTIRAALAELVDFGRSKGIRLAVLVDRGGHELPIAADITGMTYDVQEGEAIHVFCQEKEGEDKVVLEDLEEGSRA